MIEQLFRKFQSTNVLVVGDVMIDAYLAGRVERISPEAPVPIMEVKHREYRLGGAANVALNLKALGANPILCSVIGQDDKAKIFLNLLDENQLLRAGMLQSEERKTTIKYRIIGNKSQMLRIDEEDTTTISEPTAQSFFELICQLIVAHNIHALIFEDYDKGVLTPELISKLVAFCKSRGVLTTVDPKKRNFSSYIGVDLFKPNLKELSDGLHRGDEPFSMDKVEQQMRHFCLEQQMGMMMTTLSERGVAIFDGRSGEFFAQPAFLRKISDVSGAGDTVISVATLCLVAQLSAPSIAYLANLAGGIVCEYAGVVPIDAAVLQAQIEPQRMAESEF